MPSSSPPSPPTLLTSSPPGPGPGPPSTTRPQQHSSLLHTSVVVVASIAAWYLFSSALSLFNKHLLGKENFNFNFPLLLSAVHSVLHLIVSHAVLSCRNYNTPISALIITPSSFASYIASMGPTAVCAALDIGLSNASLHLISLSFYTMVKSSVPVWVLAFAFLFGLEQVRLTLIAIIFVICFGVYLTIVGELRFNFLGFVLVLCAAIISGLRWNLTQILLARSPTGNTHHHQAGPLTTLYNLSPIMAVILGVWSLASERDAIAQSPFFKDLATSSTTLLLLSAGGFLALLMTLAEFYLISNTNVVSLSVAGIFKEIFMIALSMMIFGDTVTPMAVVGVLISICGIAAYTLYKLEKAKSVRRGLGGGAGSAMTGPDGNTMAGYRPVIDIDDDQKGNKC